MKYHFSLCGRGEKYMPVEEKCGNTEGRSHEQKILENIKRQI